MEVYTDAYYVVVVTDRESTLVYCMFVGENSVTWISKKQNAVGRSSVEVEF